MMIDISETDKTPICGGVYFLFTYDVHKGINDSELILTYIGKANILIDRLEQHRYLCESYLKQKSNSKGYVKVFHKIFFIKIISPEVRHNFEYDCINTLNPLFNNKQYWYLIYLAHSNSTQDYFTKFHYILKYLDEFKQMEEGGVI